MAARPAPSSVRIGPYTYGVSFDETIRRSTDNELLDGLTDHDSQTIQVDSTLAADRSRVILIHEIGHGIFHAAGVELEPEVEERVVSRIAPWLLGLLRDNPELVAHLVK